MAALVLDTKGTDLYLPQYSDYIRSYQLSYTALADIYVRYDMEVHFNT